MRKAVSHHGVEHDIGDSPGSLTLTQHREFIQVRYEPARLVGRLFIHTRGPLPRQDRAALVFSRDDDAG